MREFTTPQPFAVCDSWQDVTIGRYLALLNNPFDTLPCESVSGLPITVPRIGEGVARTEGAVFPPGEYQCDSGARFTIGQSGVVIDWQPVIDPRSAAWPVVCLSTLTAEQVLALPYEVYAEIEATLAFTATEIPQPPTNTINVKGEAWSCPPLPQAALGTWYEITNTAIKTGLFGRFTQGQYGVLARILASAFTPGGVPFTTPGCPNIVTRAKALADAPIPQALGAYAWLIGQIDGLEQTYRALFTAKPEAGTMEAAWAQLYSDYPQRLGKDLGFQVESQDGLMAFLNNPVDTTFRSLMMHRSENAIRKKEALLASKK